MENNDYVVRVGSLLTGAEIVRQRDKGNIVITPFNPEHLNPNSFNLTLNPKMKVYTKFPLDPKDKDPEMKTVIIPEEGLVLQPGELYIACINEWTETYNLIPMLNGRSSVGRVGLFVHVTAGFGDIGYQGNWTLELTAVVPVIVYPNMKICQIYYHTPYGEIKETYKGKYQGLKEAQGSLFSQDYDVADSAGVPTSIELEEINRF